jgi:hypothetical protein
MEVILRSSRSFIHTYVVTIIQSSNQREHWCLIIDNFICHYFPGFCLLLLVILLSILFFNILFLLVFQTIELGCFYGINNVFIIFFLSFNRVHFVDSLEIPLEDLFFILFVIWEERAQVFDPRRTNQVFVIFFSFLFYLFCDVELWLGLYRSKTRPVIA